MATTGIVCGALAMIFDALLILTLSTAHSLVTP
jgi:hypothetical protein